MIAFVSRPFTAMKRKWRRRRGTMFLKRLRKMLIQLDHKLKNAGYERHERRQIMRGLVGDIQTALKTFLHE